MSDLLPVVEYATRLERTQALLAERGLEGIVVFSGARERGGRVAYLCNHRLAQPAAINRAGLDFAALVLPARGAGVLVAPAGYDDGLVTGVESVRAGGALVSEIVEAVEGYCQGSARWGLAGLDVIPAAHYVQLTEALSALEWAPADAILVEQRQIKSAAEIAALEQSAGVAQAGLQAGLAAAIPGARQRQVRLAVRRGCLEAGAEVVHCARVAAGPFVPAQERPARSQGPLAEGDFVYLQVWGWAQGYGFNASRVKVIGPPSAQQQDYLQHLTQATAWMTDRMEPERQITFYYTESRGREIHPRAFGIGLELAEEPWLQIQQALVPRQGMALCVAPLVACKTFGRMSISRTIVIEEHGPRALAG